MSKAICEERPESFLPKELIVDRNSMGAYEQCWSIRLAKEVGQADGNLTRYEESRQRIEKFIQGNIPPKIWSGQQFGIGPWLDGLFRKIRWFDEYNAGGRSYADLKFLGLNPKGAESIWPGLSSLAREYSHQRSAFPLPEQSPLCDTDEAINQAFGYNKAVVSDATATVSSTLNGALNQDPIQTEQAVIEFCRGSFFSGTATLQDIPGGSIRLQQQLITIADSLLAQKLQIPQTALPYSWILKQQDLPGVTVPNFENLVRFNKALNKGQQIDLYCCPNYSLGPPNWQGISTYTFGSLGTDIGLTAERGIPFIERLIRQVTNLKGMDRVAASSDVSAFRIAIADFEATPENAELVGLSVDDFRERLGRSVQNMVDLLGGHLLAFAEVVRKRIPDSSNEPIGEWELKLTTPQGMRTKISFGAVTQTYRGIVPGYTGAETFARMVQEKRRQLEGRVASDKQFQDSLDQLLKLRLGLMLKWGDGSEPSMILYLGELYGQLTQNQFSETPPVAGISSELIDKIRGIVDSTEDPVGKNSRVKQTIVEHLKRGSDGDLRALDVFRRRIARQGAEYATMGELKRTLGGGQIVADSAAMWDTFGGNSIGRLIVKGGYEGA